MPNLKLQQVDPTTNGLLARLEREDYDALMLNAKIVVLKFRARLVSQDGNIDAIYFPLSSMVSLLVTTEAGRRWKWPPSAKRGSWGPRRLFSRKERWA